MAVPSTTSQLYPPTCLPEFWRFLHAISTGDRDDKGNFILHRSLTARERTSMQDRAQALSSWFTRAKRGDIAAVVVPMLLGFGGGATSRDEAVAIAKQYAEVLSDLPLWAVVRACQRFAAGQVTAEELKDKMFSTSLRPSTAHIRKIAVEIVRPFGEESTRLSMTLRGSVGKPPTPEERELVAEKLAAFAKELKALSDASESEDRERAHARIAERNDRNRKAILAEYASKGLDPVLRKDGQPVALGTMLSVGWTIEGDGLVAPPPAPEPQHTEGT